MKDSIMSMITERIQLSWLGILITSHMAAILHISVLQYRTFYSIITVYPGEVAPISGTGSSSLGRWSIFCSILP